MWMPFKVFRCPKTQNDYNFKVKLSECSKSNDQNRVQVYTIDSRLPNKTSKKNFSSEQRVSSFEHFFQFVHAFIAGHVYLHRDNRDIAMFQSPFVGIHGIGFLVEEIAG